MGCEPGIIDGRPCDWSGWAASPNPSVSFLPACLPTVQRGQEVNLRVSAWTSIETSVMSRSMRTARFARPGVSPARPSNCSCPRRACVATITCAGDDRQRAEHRQDPRAARGWRAGCRHAQRPRADARQGQNDRVDAQLIAKLLAAGMLPGTWVCDEQTSILRRQITRRSQLVRGRTRARNQIHAVVIRNLGGRAPQRHVRQQRPRLARDA